MGIAFVAFYFDIFLSKVHQKMEMANYYSKWQCAAIHSSYAFNITTFRQMSISIFVNIQTLENFEDIPTQKISELVAHTHQKF